MTTTLLGAGVYDAREVGHLLAEPVERILRWGAPDRAGNSAVVAPSLGRVFSFVDLVGLAVATQLSGRGVPDTDLRRGVAYLRRLTGHEQPLSHRDTVALLATSGSAWLADVEGRWLDIGRGGQGAFDEVVQIYLSRLSYDDAGMACLWRPAPMVLINPAIQGGAPCVEDTRIPTDMIASMILCESEVSLADDLDLTVAQIEAAISFEEGLLAGRGLAA